MATPSLITLSAVELRRLIGIKEISPVELLEACIARIEALKPAVNAIAARAFERARTEAKAAEAAVSKARRWAACTDCRSASRTCRTPRACSPRTARRSIAITSPRRDSAHGGARCARPAPSSRPRPTCPSSAPAPIRATRSGAPPAIRSIRRSSPAARPADRRWRWRATCCRSAPAPTPAARCASRPAICGVVGFRPSPGLVPMDGRPLGWTPISVLGPDGAHGCRTRRMLFAAQAGMVDAAIRCPSRSTPDAVAARAARRSRPPARGLDGGLRPVPGRARDPRADARAGRRDAPPVPRPATRSRSTSARPTAAST